MLTGSICEFSLELASAYEKENGKHKYYDI